MLPLKLFRGKEKGFCDLLNWAALVDDGLILGKDGSLMAGYFYRGQDIASSTDEERNSITARVNAALSRLGSGWVSWVEAIRLPVAAYSPREASHFPDPITELIDCERRKHFMGDGNHYESEYALILQYLPPLRRNSKITDLIYSDRAENSELPATRIMTSFQRALYDLEDRLGDGIKLRRMRSYQIKDRFTQTHMQDELVNYLQFCVSGDGVPIHVPPVPMYMDAYLGNVSVFVGDSPKVGNKFIKCISLDGFPAQSYPGILDILDHMAISYRWSSRFIYLDQHEAISDLKKYRRKWKQQVRGFWTQVFRTQGGLVNEDALMMANQTENAMTDAHSAMVTFGYYTPVIVLMDESLDVLTENARLLVREIQREGFNARIETVNTMEAWLGTLPGHPIPNIRRPLMHTLSLVDMLPLASVWPGLAENPCPLYPEGSPPLLQAATVGATPFRLNLHVDDLGHTLIFGPTGAGKSVLLATIAAQFRRYPKAQLTAFDKGRSMMALALAVGGQYYDLAHEANAPGLCPLAFLETDQDAAWAEDWIATSYELQAGKAPTPRQREDIHRAIRLMRETPHGRSLTDFIATVQDETIRSALGYYTIDGPLGKLLDSRQDELRDASFSVFEIEDLMALGEKSLIPVLLYLFRRFEKSLKGQPALLLLDEAWVMLGHPTFREKIREWLKVLRKANCAVVLATQSLSDAVKSGLLDVLMEACPTKILLPNEEADKAGTDTVPGPRDFYTLFGLNETEINIVKSAVKKRHYYYISPEGRRLFDLSLGPVALSFVAVSDKIQNKRVRDLHQKHGSQWPYLWLKERGVAYEAFS